MNLNGKTIKKFVGLASSISLVLISLAGTTLPAQADAINTTDFVITVDTTKSGNPDDAEFKLYFNPVAVDFNVDWENDGIIDQTNVQIVYPMLFVSHTYATPGVHTIRLSGSFPMMNFTVKILNDGNGYDFENPSKLIDVVQWGDQKWKSMYQMFSNCNNLSTWTATDNPDLSLVTDMTSMFGNATKFNQPIGSWDTSSVTNMAGMFGQADNFNQNINSWDVSSVTNMTYMFSSWSDDSKFNQPLDLWNTSKVNNMFGMFYNQVKFNQDISSWNTSNVRNMATMFYKAKEFNQPVDSWNTANVTDMHALFASAESFNQPVDSWNTSNVTNMSSMFANAAAFNQPLSTFDTSKVTDMGGMFSGAISFNKPLSTFDTSNVTDMGAMFNAGSPFNQPLSSWNTAKVRDMGNMFTGSLVFNQPLNSWNTSSVLSMHGMFQNTAVFNQPLNSWDTHNVLDMYGLVAGNSVFNQSLGSFDVSKVYTMDKMLDSSGLSQANYDSTLSAWGTNPASENVYLSADTLRYCNSVVERANLINSHSWHILSDQICDPKLPNLDNLASNAPIQGVGAPGATIKINFRGNVLSAIVPASGAFSFAAPAAGWAVGTSTIYASQTDHNLFNSYYYTDPLSRGDYSNSAEVPISVTVYDVSAPFAPVINSPISGVTVNTATPTISGTGEANATLAVTRAGNNVCTVLVNYSGAWSCVSAALPGGAITLTATQKDDANNVSPTDTVTFNVNLSAVATITGTPQVRKTLTATVTLIPSGSKVSAYRWYRDGRKISHSSKSTYKATQTDYNKTVYVQVDILSSLRRKTTIKSNSVYILPAPISITSAPKITGVVQLGRTVKINKGHWSTTPTKFTYKWLINGVVVSGATKSSYRIPSIARGQKLSVEVTGTKLGYAATPARSAEKQLSGKALTVKKIPSLSGTLKSGYTMKVTSGSWSPSPSKYSYKWLINGVIVSGATSSSYKIPLASAGKSVSAQVTAYRGGYDPITVSSLVKLVS